MDSSRYASENQERTSGMDSKEKKATGPATTDELDLEPLDLDFDLELPSLDEPPGGDSEFDLLLVGELGEDGMASFVEPTSADEEGPITLTADELDDIVSADLAGAGAGGVGGAYGDGELALPALDEDDLAFEGDEDLVPFGGESPGMDALSGFSGGAAQDLDLEASPIDADLLDLDLSEDFGSGAADEKLTHPEPIDIDPALEGEVPRAAPGVADLGDDELISLSEDELDNILGDLDDEGEAEAEPGEESEGAQALAAGFDDAPARSGAASGFSGEPELPETGLEAPTTVSILDADEDESITLTADELSNIVSEDVPVVDQDDAPGFDAGADFDSSAFSMEPDLEMGTGLDIGNDLDIESGMDALPSESSFFQDEGEEGPVALTDDELADILEGTTVEAAPGGGPELAAAAPRSERMAEELSMETGFKRDELKQIIGYLDNLLGQLPEDTVREFSRSEYFNLYKKVIEDLGIYQ